MKNSILTKIILILGGLIGLYVGVGLVFFPVQLQAQSDIFINGNISHLSETRAPGTAILVASILILFGAFQAKWAQLSLFISTLFFLSYGLGRLISLALDGMPAEGLFIAMLAELFMGLLALIALIRTRRLEKQ